MRRGSLHNRKQGIGEGRGGEGRASHWHLSPLAELCGRGAGGHDSRIILGGSRGSSSHPTACTPTIICFCLSHHVAGSRSGETVSKEAVTFVAAGPTVPCLGICKGWGNSPVSLRPGQALTGRISHSPDALVAVSMACLLRA